MSEQSQFEELSALVDDELPDARRVRAIDALASSDDQLERWERYHLIGAAMRAEASDARSLLAAVRRDIGSEPVALAPRRRSLRPAVGFAVAASVAAVAVITLRLILGASPEPGAGVTTPAVAVVVPAPAITTPVSPPQVAIAPDSQSLLTAGGRIVVREKTDNGGQLRLVTEKSFPRTPENSRLAPAAKVRLNRYVMSHSETTRNGMRGMFPYAALVSHRER